MSVIGAEQLRLIPKREPGEVLERAFRAVNPSKAYILFSGGKDSSVTTEYLWRNHSEIITGVIHCNTTIADPETVEFVRGFCAERKLTLNELWPERTYEEMVEAFGFFGPGMHKIPYNELKGKPIEAFSHRQQRDRNDRILLLSGVRASESVMRGRNARELFKRGSIYYGAPLIDFSTHDMGRYRMEHSVPMSPCSELMCFSGDCWCGSKAKPGERKEIALWRPVVDAQIEHLTIKARAAGKHDVWGTRPPGVQPIDDPNEELPLCVGCDPIVGESA